MEKHELQIGDLALSRDMVLDFTKIQGLYPTIPKSPSLSAQQGVTEKGRSIGDLSISPFIPKFQQEHRDFSHAWTLLDESRKNKKGYDGALFSVDVEGQPPLYVIYHSAAADVKDFAAIGRLAEGQTPKQVKEAEDFIRQAKAQIQAMHPGGDAPQVLHVGYSLGGAIGALASSEGEPMLAIDPPAISRVLEKKGRDLTEAGKNLVTILPPHETLINSHGKHIGEVLIAGEKYWQTDHISIQDFWNMSWKSHDIVRLGEALDAMGNWSKIPAEKTGRAETVLDAFKVYFNEHSQARPLATDEKLLAWMKDHPLAQDLYELGSKFFGRIGRALGGKTTEPVSGHAERILQERAATAEQATPAR